MTVEPISTRAQLCEHLRTAVVLELSKNPATPAVLAVARMQPPVPCFLRTRVACLVP